MLLYLVFAPVLENQCCHGLTVGGRFEELRDIIRLVNNKSRVGVSLNTCHLLAAGKSTPVIT